MNAPFVTGRLSPSPNPTGDTAGRRILALFFPYLAPERILRQRFGRAWRVKRPAALAPLVVSRHESNTQRIWALDEGAEALGLKRGMGLADARAMHPGLDVIEADPAADARLLEALVDWCDRYTPLVALDGQDGLFLDVTGCTHLFGGERGLLDDLLARFLYQGFDVRAGLASSPGAAWAAARFRSGLMVDRGAEASLLEELPLAALRLEAELRQGLESVGLRTAGALMAAPRAPLVRRFGHRLMLRLDQALGRAEEAVSPRLPVAPLSVERHFPDPIVSREDVEALVAPLAARLKEELVRRGQGARAMELALFRVDGAVSRVAIRMARALREPVLVQKLFRERFGKEGAWPDAGYGFDLVRLSVLAVVEMAEVQASLAGGELCAGEELAHFADRVSARFGREGILRPVPLASHIPERAVALAGFGQAVPAPAPAPRIEGAARRPLRLFRPPEPVDVTAEIPEGPPLSFRWRRAVHQVARAEGPERIAPEWWRLPALRGGEEEEEKARAEAERLAGLSRDYFQVEDKEGRRYWLFRQGFYGAPQAPRWFLHGIFA